MRRKTVSRIFVAVGILLLAAALGISSWNIVKEKKAETTSENIVEQIENRTQEKTVNDVPDYILDPEMDMPSEVIDGLDCIGIIEIPGLNVKLPVASSWNMANLEIVPCRYKGSAYTDNLILCSHNYSTQFGRMNILDYGSDVYFTDATGNRFHYVIVDIETLQPTAVEEMEAGDWDLTLFTCTYAGRARITVRCERVEE